MTKHLGSIINNTIDKSKKIAYSNARVNVQSDGGVKMDRKEVILYTMMKLVEELGLKGSTISQLAKRAKLSPGIIYHYYESKDEIIHQLYKNIEEEFVERVIQKNPLELPIKECYKAIWLSAYEYSIQNPQEMHYIESYQNSAYFKDSISTARNEFLSKLQEKNKKCVINGELKDLPIETIYAMTGRVAIEIAKISIAGKDPFHIYQVDEIAESVVNGIMK